MGVAGLTFGGRTKYRRDVVEPLDIGLLSKIQIAAIRLGLAGEGRLQILFGLRALQAAIRSSIHFRTPGAKMRPSLSMRWM